ncbi:MAG: Bug family tripartite tricarboxylate transporter substrate binding protein [Betaproteobacteria bacterium]
MKRFAKRTAALLLLASTFVAAFASPALAQKFPAGPITMVVSYPPGGLSDLLARLLATRMAETLGTPVVVENRPGANGSIGTAAVARAKPDGHTITLLPASVVTTNQWLMKGMPFDPIKDLQPLSIALVVPNVLLVHPSVPAKSAQELIEFVRGKPGAMNFASVGMGSSSHLQGEMLAIMASLKMTHVPFKGAGPAMQALVAGQVQLAFENLPAAMPYIKSGQLRALGVTTPVASPQMPELPPLNRTLPGFEASVWFGVVGPAGMPRETIATLNEHIVRGMKSADMLKAMEARGGQVSTSTPEEMGRIMREDSERMRKVVTDAGITAQ